MEDKFSAPKFPKMKVDSSDQQNSQIYGTLGTKYILLHKIGKGLSSHVFLAKKNIPFCFPSDDLLAIKVCKKDYNQKLFSEEGIILKKLPNCPYIIKVYESGKALLTKKKKDNTRTAAYHVLEYLENGVLFNYIHLKQGVSKGFGEKLGRVIFHQLILAVEVCHKNYIAHKDIKIENILLSSDFQIKLADFGFATEECHCNCDNSNKAKFTFFGTDGYFPPEVYTSNGSKYIDSFQCDIFALGVFLFYIVFGFKPFIAAKRNDNNYKKIIRRNYEGFWAEWQSKTGEVSRDFKELFNKLVAANKEERYQTVEEIKFDKWMINSGFENQIEFDKSKKDLAYELENRKKFMFS
ncbi:MAG: protein kinase [archaeon]|nr:protein kinase [archaeon]